MTVLKVHRDGREVLNTKRSVVAKAEYNRRILEMADRQDGLCALCGRPLGEDMTFDHEHGRGHGGAKRDDRIEVDGKKQNATVHYRCNSEKGSRRIPYLLQ